MKSLYNSIQNENKILEGVLMDVEKSIETADTDLAKMKMDHIISILTDKSKFLFYDTKHPWDIKLENGECYVDVFGQMTVFDFITDGSFKFRKVNGNYIISNPEGGKKLKSLEGGPVEVTGDFDIYYGAGLKDLKGCPEKIGGNLFIGGTKINSLKYFPKEVGGSVRIMENPKITKKSLNNLPPCKIGDYLTFFKNGVGANDLLFSDFKKWKIGNLRTSVIEGLANESILDDVETNIASGDNAIDVINEFEQLKSFVLDKKNWKVEGSSRSTRMIFIDYKLDISRILKGLNISSTNKYIKHISFRFYKHTYSNEYRGGFDLWDRKDYDVVGYSKYHEYGSFVPNEKATTPLEVLKYYLKPMFKDLDTFTDTLNKLIYKK